jgi:3-oxoacyl-[acyl-carrier protein] reductase
MSFHTDPNVVGRVAFVTGASRGIGASCAEALGASGHLVAVGYRSGGDEAEALVDAIVKDGGEAMAVQVDVTDPASVDGAVGRVEKAWAPVAVLVSNAGVTGDGLFARMTDERWRNVMSANLDGAFHVARRVTGPMMRARWGRIITLSSVVALSGSGGQVNYAAAKAGLIGYTKTVAAEVARRGITVNAVAPGLIATDMTADLDPAVVEHVPARRMGTPEEVAACVAFLCSDAAAYVTGTTLTVDGGMSA